MPADGIYFVFFDDLPEKIRSVLATNPISLSVGDGEVSVTAVTSAGTGDYTGEKFIFTFSNRVRLQQFCRMLNLRNALPRLTDDDLASFRKNGAVKGRPKSIGEVVYEEIAALLQSRGVAFFDVKSDLVAIINSRVSGPPVASG